MKSTHLLRPVFTERTWQKLAGGAALHIQGTKALGLERLLSDVKSLSRTATIWMELDLAEFGRDVQSLFSAWARAFSMEVAPTDFREFVGVLKANGVATTLVIRNLGAAVTEGADPNFHTKLFEQLNVANLIPQIGLLTIDSKSMAELELADTWLHEEKRLPPLGFRRIQEELERKLPELKTPVAIVSGVFAHPQPFPFLEYVINEGQLQTDLSGWNSQAQVDRLIEGFAKSEG
ncbi:hypothetical protein [Pontibacter sp. G13]|uniref:hypothetical protein n=1 Tax=Pontibacter sp. G13 TaxID=3074898 RepID=UPI0028892F0D|nr:hypothetical protein [Pontibacter sp. G13]WNJ21332.1 hypothetical protein RJD25_12755 [Pontibacter sp. G13]